MTERRYADPSALRRAVTDRLRTLARDRHAQLADLQRQFAYDRLLARLFVSEPDRWVLKGATALLARLGGAARHTLDVDLYRPGERLVETEAALRAAAASDLGDFFRLALAPGRRVAEGRDTIRIAVTAYLGATEFAAFHVDLIAGIAMTGEPDEVRPLVPLALPGIPAPDYRVYPIADHVADKLCALLETHPRATGPGAAEHPLPRPGRPGRYRSHPATRRRSRRARRDLRGAPAWSDSPGPTSNPGRGRLAARLRSRCS